MILLTDEEINKTIIDATMRTTSPKSAWRAMCKAQLKEVVEEFKKYELALEHDNRVFVYPNKLWQALLEEAG